MRGEKLCEFSSWWWSTNTTTTTTKDTLSEFKRKKKYWQNRKFNQQKNMKRNKKMNEKRKKNYFHRLIHWWIVQLLNCSQFFFKLNNAMNEWVIKNDWNVIKNLPTIPTEMTDCRPSISICFFFLAAKLWRDRSQ